MSAEPRIAVIIPCYDDGEFVGQTVRSVVEDEPVELVIVDDGSTDPDTIEVLEELERQGHRVLHHERNLGISAARMTGLAATSAPYVFPLDSDDLGMPGVLAEMADRLDADQEAAVCVGDYLEFRVEELIRGVPGRLDPYRLAYTNEYPPCPMVRRETLVAAGGWQPLSPELDSQADWSLWMALAERGVVVRHLGQGRLLYLRRIHAGRLAARGRRRRRVLYRALRTRHRKLFGELRRYRRQSEMGPLRRLLYPIVYGRRPRLPGEPQWKSLLDRLGIWTLTHPGESSARRESGSVIAAAYGGPWLAGTVNPVERRPADDARRQRVAVIIPCHDDGEFVGQTVRSVVEDEPVELVVVDDGSTDPDTVEVLEELERHGHRVLRHERNLGVSAARMTGLAATGAPYVFPLDSDDLAMPGVLAEMADRLDADQEAAACVGDYLEFRVEELIRAVPDRLDPYRLAYTNEYPNSSLYRRTALAAVGGWREGDTYEDWDLWLALAEAGARCVHIGQRRPVYARRVHPGRRGAEVRAHHPRAYRQLRQGHSRLFAELGKHRRNSDMGVARRLVYPLLYGGRPRLRGESAVKALMDRYGIWTLRG